MSRIIYLRQEKRKRGRKRGDLRHEARAVRLTRPEMITENKRQARTLEAPKSMGGRGRPYQVECPSLLTLCAGFGAWVRFFGFKQELVDEMDDAREKRKTYQWLRWLFTPLLHPTFAYLPDLQNARRDGTLSLVRPPIWANLDQYPSGCPRTTLTRYRAVRPWSFRPRPSAPFDLIFRC